MGKYDMTRVVKVLQWSDFSFPIYILYINTINTINTLLWYTIMGRNSMPIQNLSPVCCVFQSFWSVSFTSNINKQLLMLLWPLKKKKNPAVNMYFNWEYKTGRAVSGVRDG